MTESRVIHAWGTSPDLASSFCPCGWAQPNPVDPEVFLAHIDDPEQVAAFRRTIEAQQRRTPEQTAEIKQRLEEQA